MRLWWGNLEEGDHWEDLRMAGRILKWNLKKYNDMGWGDFIQLRIRKSDGLFEHSHEPLGFIKMEGILDWLLTYHEGLCSLELIS
jgi:hypothetical protein